MELKNFIPDMLFAEFDDEIGFYLKILQNSNNFEANMWQRTKAEQGVKTYVVKPLDTLEKICQKLNISEYELKQKLNGEKLYIGKKIEV